jgi:hypothetical protein
MLVVNVKAGGTYPFHAPANNRPIVFTSGPSTRPKSLGRAAIGLSEPCCVPPEGYNPATDRYITTHESP